jgi:hypothetical protein
LFDNGTKKRNEFNDVDIENANTLQFGLMFGIGYEFPLRNNILLVPEVSYTLNFTKIADVD